MGNYYWVPERGRDNEKIRDVKIIEYARHIVLFYRGIEMAKYPFPKNNQPDQQYAFDKQEDFESRFTVC